MDDSVILPHISSVNIKFGRRIPLIAGGIWQSLWLFVFAAAGTAKNPITDTGIGKCTFFRKHDSLTWLELTRFCSDDCLCVHVYLGLRDDLGKSHAFPLRVITCTEFLIGARHMDPYRGNISYQNSCQARSISNSFKLALEFLVGLLYAFHCFGDKVQIRLRFCL